MIAAAHRDSVPPTLPSPCIRRAESRTRVLLAEGDREMRSVIAAALRRDGHEVLEAHDGARLLDLIASSLVDRAGGGIPEIIVSDIQMPQRSGLEVLAGLRRDDWVTPVILLSPSADLAMHAEAYRLGADVVLDKPLDVDDLRVAVRALVTMRC